MITTFKPKVQRRAVAAAAAITSAKPAKPDTKAFEVDDDLDEGAAEVRLRMELARMTRENPRKIRKDITKYYKKAHDRKFIHRYLLVLRLPFRKSLTT